MRVQSTHWDTAQHLLFFHFRTLAAFEFYEASAAMLSEWVSSAKLCIYRCPIMSDGKFRILQTIGVARHVTLRGNIYHHPKFSQISPKFVHNFLIFHKTSPKNHKISQIFTKFPEILRIGEFKFRNFIFVCVSVVVVVGRGRETYKCN